MPNKYTLSLSLSLYIYIYIYIHIIIKKIKAGVGNILNVCIEGTTTSTPQYPDPSCPLHAPLRRRGATHGCTAPPYWRQFSNLLSQNFFNVSVRADSSQCLISRTPIEGVVGFTGRSPHGTHFILKQCAAVRCNTFFFVLYNHPAPET